METETMILIASCGAFAASLLALVFSLTGRKNNGVESAKKELLDGQRATRTELNAYMQSLFKNSFDMLAELQKGVGERQDARLDELIKTLTESQRALRQSVTDMLTMVDERFKSFSQQNEQRLENIRKSMTDSLTVMMTENGKKLDEMRNTVDEKLQKTLEERLQLSFEAVNEQLKKVYSGLGEMRAVAADVGDLKKVLANVKTRGTLGEFQLGAILEQILSPEQYDANVATKKDSKDVVEYAVKLPGDGDESFVYLPIDAKFPADAYQQLLDARDAGAAADIEASGKNLEQRIKQNARDIRQKYVSPPETTDFGILFLPFEGLYAEVVQRGMVEVLQREYKIMIAGPTTMAALLNSLQMGFRTLAIKKHTSEVWNALASVKTEFDKFADVLAKTQMRLDQARGELETLVGTRTRKIRLRLNAITRLGEDSETGDFKDAVSVLDFDAAADEDTGEK